MNKEEATGVQAEILRECNGLTEKTIMLVLPSADYSLSHGYQIHIKSTVIATDLSCLKAICQKHNLTLDESKKELVVIYRPCFIDYASRKLL